MSLKIEIIKEKEDFFTVLLSGSLDSETYTQLEEKLKLLLNPSTKLIVFDLRQLEYISSMGLRVIFNTQSFLKKQNGSIIITNLQPQVKKVFDILKILPDNIFKSIEEVDAYITEIQKPKKDKENY